MRRARLLASIVVAFVLLISGNAGAQENWPMYGGNLLHTFSNAASRINPGNVRKLKPRWTFSTTDARQCIADCSR
jgi:glucose dehydrogenase